MNRLLFGTHYRVDTVGAEHVCLNDHPIFNAARTLLDAQIATIPELLFEDSGVIGKD